MANPVIDLSGKKFGRLTIIERYHKPNPKGKPKHGQAKWLCSCDCGEDRIIDSSDLRNGHVVSCGCYRKERNLKHGLSDHPLYQVFASMVQRCCNENTDSFKNYGGRGIKISQKWRKNPSTFIQWAFANGWKKGLHIDRRDNDKGYLPGNCRFITQAENNKNQRLLRVDNKTGYVGVSVSGNKYLSKATLNHKSFYLGLFRSPIEAAIARDIFMVKNKSNKKLNFQILKIITE